MGWPAWASAGRGPFTMQNTEDSRMKTPRSRLIEWSVCAEGVPPLKRLPDAPVEGVDAVFVAPQDPRETIGLIELEQDDLVTSGGRQAARVGQVEAVREPLEDRQPHPWLDVARRLQVGILKRGRDLERIDAERLLDNAADLC